MAFADLIEYTSFHIVMNTLMIEYTGVTLLKHMCGKKPGTKIEKILLNPKDGSWSIPKTAPVPDPKKKNIFVEFKGVHTRFEDSDESIENILEYVPSSTFKVFEGRKRVTKIDVDTEFYEKFCNYIHDLGSGSSQLVTINAATDLIRVAGIDLQAYFELKKRYKLQFENYSIVRVC